MGWLQILLGPLTSVIGKFQDRKLAQQTAKTKIEQAKQDDAQAIQLHKDEWEQLKVNGMDKTWKDEYVTVSVMSIFNIVVVGGLLSAFGRPEVLEGIVTAVTSLTAIGVDVGFLLSATVLSGLGLSVWKRM